MLSTGLQKSFLIPLSTPEPSLVTGDGDVGVGFHHNDQFVGDHANVTLKYLQDIERLDDSSWPLVFSGSSGTGKTALALSVASQIASHTHRPAAVFAANSFRRRYASSLETNSIDQFHQSITSSSVLLIDNLQNLSGYDAAQDELISIVDDMVNSGRPVIFTATNRFLEPDCLDYRLVSRLSTGLCINVSPPGESARKKIISDQSISLGINLRADATVLLARELKLTYPKIKSFLNSLAIWLQSDDSKYTGGPVEKNLVAQYFEIRRQSNFKVVDFIIQEVSAAYKLTPGEIKSTSRKQSIVMARGVAIYLLRHTLGISFAKIGDIFGGRDHSTIMHAASRISALIKENKSLDLIENVKRIRSSIEEIGTLDLGCSDG